MSVAKTPVTTLADPPIMFIWITIMTHYPFANFAGNVAFRAYFLLAGNACRDLGCLAVPTGGTLRLLVLFEVFLAKTTTTFVALCYALGTR